MNWIPGSKLKDSKILHTEFLGHKLSHPVGLAPGIDISGSGIINLNKLGFEFIESGPFCNECEPVKSNPEISLKHDSLFFTNLEDSPPIEDSLAGYQKVIKKNIDTNSNPNLIFSTNIKLSPNCLRTVPYMSDSLFVKMVKASILLSDFTTINLSSYDNKAILQYKNLEKFESFLSKLKEEVLYDTGVKAVIEHERINKYNNKGENLTAMLKLDYPVHFFKRSRSKLLLRLDTQLEEEELEGLYSVIQKSGIIDGIVIGGMLKYNKSGKYICGEESKIESLNLLRNLYKLTKGEMPIVSTGGVINGEDVYERLQNGADLVLLYTPFMINGPYCLDQILSDLENKMIKEGKSKIKDILLK